MKLLVSLGVFAVVGCGGGGKMKSKQDLEAEHGASVRLRMGAIVAAGKVAEENRNLLGTASNRQDVDVDYSDNTGNTVIVQSDDLASLTEDAKPAFRFAELSNDDVRTAKEWTGANVIKSSGNWAVFEDKLERVIAAKYLLVVFAGLDAAPSVGLAGTTFTPGKAKATVVLVEIDGMKPHGGFEVAATNSTEITTKKTSGAGTAEELQRKVDADLAAQLGKAISAGIRKRWTNAKAPYNWGFGY